MAKGINKVILVGHAGQDTELKYSQSGTAIANVSIATTMVHKDKQTGQRNEHTEWHRLVAFDRLAEIFEAYVRKGQQIYVEGRLQTKKWQDLQGQDRYTTQIVVGEMQLLGMKEGANGAPQQHPVHQAQPPQQHAPQGNYDPRTGHTTGAPQNPRQNQNGTQPSPHATPVADPYNVGNTDNFDDDIPF